MYYPDARIAAQRYADQLAGKVVVDITNPVNETFDGLVVPPDGSATAELAALAGGGAAREGVQYHVRDPVDGRRSR